jgi:hypothetical protein
VTIWQQLGAFISIGENLSNEHLDKFAACGGRWVVPVLYNDNAGAVWNLKNIDALRARCSTRGIRCGGWYNYFGDEPVAYAAAVAKIASGQPGPVIIDAEASVQYPVGKPEMLAPVTLELRRALPKRSIAVSSLGPSDAFIYNGRTKADGSFVPAPDRKSFYDLQIRLLPQWYEAWIGTKGWEWPEARMAWLRDHGAVDMNCMDITAPKHRGLPQAYVHGTGEVTGVEGSNLKWFLDRMTTTRAAGLHGFGISVYILENMSDEDFALLSAQRGKLFLV